MLSPTSNWIIPGKFIVSAMPSPDFINLSITHGIKTIISLMEPQEEYQKNLKYRKLFLRTKAFWYSEPTFSGEIIIARVPMNRKKLSSDEYVKNIAKVIIDSISLGRPVLLHCHQGRGRSMVVAAVVVGKIYGLSANESIDLLRNIYKKREIRKNKDVLSKQSKINQIKRILG